MTILFLFIGGVVALVLGLLVLGIQHYRLTKGVIVLDDEYNGPAQVSFVVHVVLRHMLKRSVYFRKFFMQYMFHILVRVMSYVDIGTSYLYAKSRNWFVESAVRNRGTVPHFWNHLKVYKKEMDQEKENEGDIK
jgi:hypothetical protein